METWNKVNAHEFRLQDPWESVYRRLPLAGKLETIERHNLVSRETFIVHPIPQISRQANSRGTAASLRFGGGGGPFPFLQVFPGVAD